MAALDLENSLAIMVEDLVADTTSETKTAVVDMAGYDEVEFLVKMGDVDAAAVLTFTVKENTADSDSSPTPTAVTLLDELGAGAISSGTLVITEDSGNLDDKIIRIGVKASALTKRYVFLSITATVESYEVDSIVAICRGARNTPITQGSTVAATAWAAK